MDDEICTVRFSARALQGRRYFQIRALLDGSIGLFGGDVLESMDLIEVAPCPPGEGLLSIAVDHLPANRCIISAEDRREAIRAIRSAVMESRPDVVPCTNVECLYRATVRVFWPVVTGDNFPTYCPLCAARMREVARVMGVQLPPDQPLPRPPDELETRDRRITL